MERTGEVVKHMSFGREVPGSSPPVAVRCGLEQVTYPQLLRSRNDQKLIVSVTSKKKRKKKKRFALKQ